MQWAPRLHRQARGVPPRASGVPLRASGGERREGRHRQDPERCTNHGRPAQRRAQGELWLPRGQGGGPAGRGRRERGLREIDRVINSVRLDVLQFHGRENEQECSIFGLPWLKAVVMESVESVQQAERDYPGALGLLLDSHTLGKRGGSGRIFDWTLIRPVTKPVWLAGGLDAHNVAQAIRAVKPFAVDVSTGVEVEPGIKDAARISTFIKAVRAVEYKI